VTVDLITTAGADRKAWDSFVERCAGASHSHLAGWPSVIERSYGHRGLRLCVREAGEVTGVLPLVLMRSLLSGRALVSLPFLDDGGICAEGEAAWHELEDAAVRLFHEQGAQVIDLRQRWATGLRLRAHGQKVTLVLDLASDPQAMWDRLDAKVRNQVRKAMRSNLSVSWAGVERVHAFYDVFAHNMRDLGSPVHAERFFQAILEEFPESARIVLVQDGSATVAAGLCLAFRDGLSLPWASSLRAYRSACANTLLYWEAIRSGCAEGYRRFDFGRSSVGSGTYRFKKQWGAAEEPLHWRYMARLGARAPMADMSGAGFRLAAAMWKRLPVAVSRVLGPAVRRQLSH
jgi:FemAB-related protein (PEP-CTERM system-associated)